MSKAKKYGIRMGPPPSGRTSSDPHEDTALSVEIPVKDGKGCGILLRHSKPHGGAYICVERAGALELLPMLEDYLASGQGHIVIETHESQGTTNPFEHLHLTRGQVTAILPVFRQLATTGKIERSSIDT